MSEIEWTQEQSEIIYLRNCNILVSAAAGSGKTTVLVERIFQRIMDEADPVNVDQFVVVTFTKAAAAHMKDRLRKRFEDELKKNPDNLHLQRQIGLLSSAHISTVHSFCGFLIQNYFHRIGLDPSFRHGTTAEVELLRNEVWDRILEEEYSQMRPDFAELANMSRFNRGDEGLGEMVFSIYREMLAQPFPLDFLERMRRFYQADTLEEWENSVPVRQLLTWARQEISEVCREQKELLERCREPGAPYYYEPHIQEMIDRTESLLAAETYGQWRAVFKGFGRVKSLRKKKDDTVSEEKTAQIEEGVKSARGCLDTLKKQLFFSEPAEALNDLKGMRGKLLALLRLTERLHEEFVKEKREKNIVDFNDLEQLALSILLRRDETEGAYVRTEAARELASDFVEVMIDEYQDSNLVQETILHAVSRDGLPGERPNLFMVGDAKQSIYRFRGGCPELIEEKLERYETDDGAACRRVDLHQNFRSREVVLAGTNRVFERAMHRDIGGVEYDADARLQKGREFPETEAPVAEKIDVYTLLGQQNPEAEGCLMAQKIREMTEGENPLYVFHDGNYRRVQYRDIAILVQANRQGQVYFDTLSEMGIPAVMEHKQGFFETREIQLMVAMLRIIDNPRQDIPLATVLLGPMFSFSDEELAQVHAENRDLSLYDALCGYDRADALYEKLQHFLRVLAALRRKVSYATVAELVSDIYDLTGIYESVRMMKDGVQRNANMDCLMEQAREFDGTTYQGLYQFVRYLERIGERTEEMGEVNLVGEEENVVRIMTIHKSKGLEFPVCILGGMGTSLKKSKGTNGFLTIRSELGIASPVVDNKKRTAKKQNLYTAMLKWQNSLDDLGEDMRKLYVAMTRAEEKLILIGCQKNTDTNAMNRTGREKCDSFLDLVLPAVHSTPELFSLYEIEQSELVPEVAKDILREDIDLSNLYSFDTSVCYDEVLEEYLEWMDAREEDRGDPLPVKVSVSDLKVRSMEELEMEDFTILGHEEEQEEMPVPAFVNREQKKDSARRGAAYGTVWHQALATMDFAHTDTEQDIREELLRLVETGRLRQEELELLNVRRLFQFFTSPLGQSMRQADRGGHLHREQPFVMGRKACEVFLDRTEEDMVLVQGIIDGYYETGEGLVLMDYKTDSLQAGQEQKLRDRYRTQMALYREALEEMTGKTVIRTVLYSFSLGEEIEVKHES